MNHQLQDDIIHRALNHCEVGIIVVNAESKIVFWNHWMTESTNLPTEDAINHQLMDIFPELSDNPRLMGCIEHALTQGRSSLLSQKLNKYPLPLYRSQADRSQGKRMHQMVIVKPIPLDDGAFFCMISINDVTKSVQREDVLQEIATHAQASASRLKANEEYLTAVFNSAQDGIITFSEDGQITQCNNAAATLFDLAQHEMERASVFDLLENFHLARKAGDTTISAVLNYHDIKQGIIELTARSNKGFTFPIEMSVSAIQNIGEPMYVSTIRDITARKNYDEHLAHVASHDSLTDLPNRSLFNDRLVHALRNARRNKTICVLMFIDVDRFKTINDSLGHDIGDEVIIETAKRLKSTLRETDTVSRLGGDEFTIILENLASPLQAQHAAEKIIDAFSSPFILNSQEIFVTLSIGIAINDTPKISHSELLRNADSAMYRSKGQGRNQYNFFSKDMNETTKRRLSLETDLRNAIANNEFELYIQPQITMENDRCTGGEALLRWHHPERGNIPPGQFIPIAEDSGIIVEIGQWVFEQSCKISKDINDLFEGDFCLSLNISPKEFTLLKSAKWYLETAKKAGIEPHQIDIEITEGCIMSDTTNSIQLLNELSSYGFHLSVDDFGTGYSSLAYLHRFPIDALKIDQSFVRNLPHDPDAISISQAIIHLAHSLRLEVIAEGVETKEQLDFMRKNRCEYVQGYYFSKPMKATAFMKWLHDQY